MSEAIISDCGKYRYTLKRRTNVLQPEISGCLFIMLNPSTADATQDDPTIRRCINFAKSWGASSMTVANLYAFRATKPKALWDANDAIGPENDKWLINLASEYKDIVCAWGRNAKPNRVKQVLTLLQNIKGVRLFCLGVTKNGSPRHPLYVKGDQKLIPWGPE